MNYELGVVIPIRSESEANEIARWARPARKYVNGVDVPWVSLLHILSLLCFVLLFTRLMNGPIFHIPIFPFICAMMRT